MKSSERASEIPFRSVDLGGKSSPPSSAAPSFPLGMKRDPAMELRGQVLDVFRRALDSVTHCLTLGDAQAVAHQALGVARRLLSPARIEAECRHVLTSGQRGAYFEAIKTHRVLTGSALKEAKDYIDALHAKPPEANPAPDVVEAAGSDETTDRRVRASSAGGEEK